MKGKLLRIALCLAAIMVLPGVALAGGGSASSLVVVADSRVIGQWRCMKYFADLYNTNILLFAVWAVALTAAIRLLPGRV